MRPNPARPWRVVVLSSLSLMATACTSLRVLPDRAREPLPVRRTDEIRLILRDGRAIHLYEAQIVGDSVVGVNRRAPHAAAPRVAVHKADVIEIAVPRSDAFKTVLAVGLGLVALTTLAVFATLLVLLSAAS